MKFYEAAAIGTILTTGDRGGMTERAVKTAFLSSYLGPVTNPAS